MNTMLAALLCFLIVGGFAVLLFFLFKQSFLCLKDKMFVDGFIGFLTGGGAIAFVVAMINDINW